MNSENNKPISVIVSPFFPFNRIFSNEIVYSLFGSTAYTPIFLDYSKDTTYDEFVLKISQIIINEKEPVYIVSFGVFSYVAGELVKRFSEKIKGVFFIEPDFYGTLLNGKYKRYGFGYKLRNQLLQFYLGSNKINKKYYYCENYSGFLFFMKDLQLKEPVKLSDFIEKNVKMAVIWGVMAKDCWPLPQILTEEYEIPVFTAAHNFVDYFKKDCTSILNSIFEQSTF
ncbi:MAG: hypothetical protein J1G30_02545 [Spirochaetales bacterium]|nr:hypothetical protein [Spirochaetales bacterium]